MFVAVVIGLITGAPETYILGQVVLGFSVFIALSFLADRPLINPIQAFVLMFYWWLGIGPAAISAFKVLAGFNKQALEVQVAAMESLWLLSFGVIIYAVFARATLRWFSGTGWSARFLLPAGDNFSTKALVIYMAVTFIADWMLLFLANMGIIGREETSILGGSKTTIWWIGVIAAVALINPLLKSSLMVYLTEPWKTIPFIVKILLVYTVFQTFLFALYGGWKGPIAFLCAYYVIAYMSRFQHPPWAVIIVAVTLFVLVIAPYVSYGRHKAALSKVQTSWERTEVFRDVLQNPELFLPNIDREIDVSVLFRGIAPLAAEMTRRNSLLEGEWGGETILWGLEIVVPRAILPEKRNMNIGNFFARTVGADIGVTSRYQTVTNISMTIPFECVGNFGWFGGVLSFGILGIFWPLFCVWLLTPDRLHSHPLTPFCIILGITVEGAFGHWLANLRGYIIPIAVLFFINRVILRGKV
ncbi:MAG: hypothetical protein JW832_12995 [Deltaproteobacteria bacterium]|nr:hypothetical protein [Deltaproteobacteria bacterium]